MKLFIQEAKQISTLEWIEALSLFAGLAIITLAAILVA